MKTIQYISENLYVKISLLCILFLFTSFSTDEFYFKENKYNDANYPKEKVYLHFDKLFYTSGEDVWFKVYLVDGNSNQPNALSKIVYVDLINPNNEIIDSRTIKIEKGGGSGEFRLSDTLISGSYFIRAYTNYMRNFDDQFFFRKQFFVQSLYANEVSSKKSVDSITNDGKNIKPDLQFFPEGGDMVTAFSNRLGFKALGVNGKGIDITGTIIDENGKEIEKFKTSGFGLGRIEFTPEKNKSYKAHIKYANQDLYYDLPKPLDNGITMRIEDISDHYQIIIQSSLEGGVNNLLLLGQQKGKIIGRAKIAGNEKASTINIPKSIFQQGIVQFTLLDEKNKPWCERLTFVESDKDQPKANITISRKNFKKRELVEIELSLNKPIQKADQTNMSISITDTSVVNPDKYGLDIRSYLLLASDLRGEIESPGYYFMSKDPKRKEMLDILMMNQGWRQFLFNDVPKEEKILNNPEKGILFSGSVRNIKDRKNISSKVKLLLKNKWLSFRDSTQTNDQGHFIFGPYNIVDSTTFTIQVIDINEKKHKRNRKHKMDYYIEFDKFTPPKVTCESYLFYGLNKDYKNSYVERSKVMQLESIYQYDSDVNELDEVVLKTIKRKRSDIYEIKKDKIGIKHSGASHLISSDQLENAAEGNLITVLESRIPGLSIQGNFITLRGNTTIFQNKYQKEPEKPLFLLDNMVTSFENIRDLRVESIDFVEVLKGSRAAIYGSMASNGVIAIYTKSATGTNYSPATEEKKIPEIHEKNEKNEISRFVHTGYYKARKFYEPIHKTKESDYSKPDYRTTIYWSPSIEFNTQGKATISFYAADISTTYRVDLQGITADGIPLKSEILIDVRE